MSVSAATKDELLAQFKRLASRSRVVPGIREFLKATGAKKYLWDGHLWPSWNAFLVEAGFAPNKLTQPFSDDEMLMKLAELTRTLGRFPTVRELNFARTKDSSIPTEKTYRVRFRNQAEMVARLRTWTHENAAWGDIAHLLPTPAASASSRVEPNRDAPSTATRSHRLVDGYVPPLIEALHDLAVGDPEIVAECEQRGLDVNVEFERRVGIALRLLGLDVEMLGQGGGRVADGIARCRAGRWALIYDAKLRRAGFVLGTEDRKFREYVEEHGRTLIREGIDSIYFGVVSSHFSLKDLDRAQHLVHTTMAKAVTLIEARTLRYLVDVRMRGELDDLQRVQRLFGVTQLVTNDAVKRIAS